MAIQVSAQENKQTQTFQIKGEVIDDETNAPINKVNVEISGGDYTTTNLGGNFTIKAKVGDLLIFKSEDFETVYYTVKDAQRVTVKVEKARNSPTLETRKSISTNTDMFKVYLDSSKYFLKKDAKKSLDYVTKALESAPNKIGNNIQSSQAYETLGDINLYWAQPDLAVDNFKESLLKRYSNNVKIKLGQAFIANNNYQESIAAFESLLRNNLSYYQQVLVYEGLGDTYKAINDSKRSVLNYQKSLQIAKAKLYTPKITDLNGKIAEAYAISGDLNEAEDYYNNSLQLAKKENKQRAAEQKNQVADFYNQNRDFDKEIQLRTETIEEIKNLDDKKTNQPISNEALTPQRQNYKIANAYVSQEKYKEAIPYLQKSIAQADAKEDLVVQKDATRKLSEIYRDIGEFDKATKSYEKYVEVVDELYIKKEQELSQAARFNKEFALKQNRIASLENERKLNESRYRLAFENQNLIAKNSRVQQWVIGSLIFIALLLLYTAYTQYKNVKQQKYNNNLLALKGLRTQMNPHFIFNALNSVNSFIAGNDERAANKYLSEFSQLMRSVLENSEEDFIPLQKEIELLELYVKLEHFRFKDKFDYKITIDENLNIEEFVIPPMLLQPYIENAVWHGLRYKEEKGLLEVNFKQLNADTIKITITDNGIGRKKSKEVKTDNQKKQKSKGMGNIKKRISILNEMYKDKVDVTIENVFDNEEGTRVILLLKK